jgi:hypothetical protein
VGREVITEFYAGGFGGVGGVVAHGG